MNQRFLEWSNEQERAELKPLLTARRVDYILISGRYWHGPIGRCRVEVAFEGLTTDHLLVQRLQPFLKRATVSKNRLVWEMKKFEPKFNVSFTMAPKITRQEIQAWLERFEKRYPNNPHVVTLLGDYLRAAKRRRDELALYDRLVRAWEQRITLFFPKRPDYELLKQSIGVLDLAEELMAGYDELQLTERARAVAPVIRRMTTRLRQQFIAHSRSKDFRGSYDSKLEAASKWCRKYGA